ncbi:MAG: undecaprenyl-diphosphatase UppP [bacterium]|nr:undecaprenyl-diphosphatase UppP [bacterium]
MSLLTAILLGIIQGLTEFIPISSTAHLTIAAAWFGVIDPNNPQSWTAFMATIQLGTLAAVVVYFYKDIASMTKAFFSENFVVRRPFREQSAPSRLAWLVIIGSIPIVVVGFLFKDFFEGTFTKSLEVIGTSLIVVGVLLAIADRLSSFKRTTDQMNIIDALIIGASQVLALIPGSSRSGTTITAGLFRGLTRPEAARFSFLLSLPAIFGAGVLEFVQEAPNLSWETGGMQVLSATAAAGITGYLSIAFLMSFLKQRSLMPFVVYRVGLGIVLLLTSCTPVRNEPASEKHIISERLDSVEPNVSVPAETSITAADTAVVTHVATVRTSKGIIIIGLYGIDAPKTVANFVALAQRRKYDGVLFHRVARGFVIQSGDPLTKDANSKTEWGKGGTTADGKPLVDELDPLTASSRIGYQKGVVAMATVLATGRKPAANSATSQFFVCLDRAASLPHQYAIFGRVIDGLDVVEAISKAEVEPGPLGDADGIPKKPILIKTVTVKSL